MTAQELPKVVCVAPAILLVFFWVIVFLALVMADAEQTREAGK